jgi:hypothetical protein
MKGKKITLIIGVSVFLLLIAFIKFSDIQLENQGILLNARTVEWVTSAKMGMGLRYEFYYNGEKIIRDNAFNDFRGNRDFEGKYFPVMYDPKLGSSQLLIVPSDFKKFHIPFPDSLQWVLSYINK